MRAPELAPFPARVRAQAARAAVASSRQAGSIPEFDEMVAVALSAAAQLSSPSLQPAINASGVILHTGLGRARLARTAAKRIAEVADAHAVVEFNLESGRRGDRQDHVGQLLCDLTGAEGALVVNNCAAAVFLTLSALCADRRVVLSRGEMVEIGGSFRMPDIVRQSGCRLVEVGCTNKTRLSDYAAEMDDETAAILRCHPSNFRIVGFTESPSIADLASLAHRKGALLIDDSGSGCVLDTTRFGLKREPRIQESIAAGSDLVLCSGDKLLGGPQAGIVIGRKEPIDRLKSHPLARALRVDKLTLAGLEATLRLYHESRELEIPVWAALGRPLESVRRDAMRLARAYPGKSVVEPGETEVGGGSLPGTSVPTVRTGLIHPAPESLALQLRRHTPPIVGRIERDILWLDPRTVDEVEMKTVLAALGKVACEHV